jgi:hypothetical protein
MFRVTEQWVRQYQSGNGGWTRDQLEALGVSWPPRNGWIVRALGKEISDENRKRFERQLDRRTARHDGRGRELF